MTKTTVDVRIDIHEPGDLTAALDTHDEVESLTVDVLDAADIAIGSVGFERKTIEDYVQSMTDDRLREQAHKMSQLYEVAYVLVEGDMTQTESPFKSGMSGESLRGSWASLTAREESGVRAVIPCSNLSLLADMAVRLARKHIEESDDDYIPKGDVTGVDEPTTKMMYACIDGIGAKGAETLYEEWPSIWDFIANASYNDVANLDGFGEKTAKAVMEGFHG